MVKSEALSNNINKYTTTKEIRQQPRLWEETYKIIKNNCENIEEFLNKVTREENIKIIFTGAGSSSFVGESVAPYLDKNLDCKVEAIATTDIVSHPLHYLNKSTPTLLISCARSGNSPESVAAVKLAEEVVDNLYQIILTCNPDGKLAEESKNNDKSLLILMPEDANDQGFAMTGSFTTMVLSSILIFNLYRIEEFETIIKDLKVNGEKVLNGYEKLISDISNHYFNRAVFLGAASLQSLARESALKLLELTSGNIETSYNSPLGFRHGPKFIVNDETLLVIYLSNDVHARKYDVDLLKEISSEEGNNKILVMSDYNDDTIKEFSDYFIHINDDNRKFEDDIFLIFNYILSTQMLSLYKSVELGINPDNPSPNGNLNRVVKGVTIYPYLEAQTI